MQTDKKMCYPGDTVWLRGFLQNYSGLRSSNNFYVELYDDAQRMITRKKFPLFGDVGFGQLAINEETGCYWLKAYTLNSIGQAIVPINVISEDRAVLRAYKPAMDSSSFDKGITLVSNGDSCIIKIDSTVSFNYSLAIVDTADPGTAKMFSFPADPTFRQRLDTLNLSYKLAFVKSGKKQKRSPDVVVYFSKDSITTIPEIRKPDSSGIITINSLYFYGTGNLHYRPNGIRGFPGKIVTLRLTDEKFPSFVPPSQSTYYTDTITARHAVEKAPDSGFVSFPNTKHLKLVEVKSRWQDRHLALNNRYVIKPEFQVIEHFTFDLRHPENAGSSYFVLEYLNRQLPPNWMGSTILSCSSGLQFYVDEQPVSMAMVSQMPLSEFAFAKIYQDLHPPCPAICLYRRKGKDQIASPDDGGILVMEGYEKPLVWSTGDSVTFLWEPYITVCDYRFKMPHGTFKVIILGSTSQGIPIQFEKIVRN